MKHCDFSDQKIPQMADVSVIHLCKCMIVDVEQSLAMQQILQTYVRYTVFRLLGRTGFRIRPISGLVDFRDFLAGLAFSWCMYRVLLCIRFVNVRLNEIFFYQLCFPGSLPLCAFSLLLINQTKSLLLAGFSTLPCTFAMRRIRDTPQNPTFATSCWAIYLSFLIQSLHSLRRRSAWPHWERPTD